MSQSASQAHKFYAEVAENKVVWAALVGKDYLKFDISDERVSLPLWSSKSRVHRIKKLNPEEFGDIEAVQITWETFVSEMAPKLESKNTLIGVNLSGKNLVGYDRDVAGVIRSVELCL